MGNDLGRFWGIQTIGVVEKGAGNLYPHFRSGFGAGLPGSSSPSFIHRIAYPPVPSPFFTFFPWNSKSAGSKQYEAF
jgi:hypothetical protein